MSADDEPPPKRRRLFRPKRRPSSADADSADASAAVDPPAGGDPPGGAPGPSDTLSRAERRRRKLAPSDRSGEDRSTELNERQRKLLGLPDPVIESTEIPATRPPPGPQRPPAWQRHDLLVVTIGLAVFVAGAIGHATLTAPALVPFARHGLSLERPAGWLPPTAVPSPPLRLAADAPLDDGAPGGEIPYHVVFSSPTDPLVSIEVRIAPRGDYDHARVALALARAARHGEAYWAERGESQTIGGHDWQRTRYRYATKVGRSSEPSVATAIEYAASHGELVFVVTFHGDESAARRLERLIAPTLAVAVQNEGAMRPAARFVSAASALFVATAAALAPAARHDPKALIRATEPGVVMVLVVDVVGGALTARASGSGTVVTADGAVLTASHVLDDEARGRPHDLFVLGRFRGEGIEPELICAGQPAAARRQSGTDLALIACDRDLDGQPWSGPRWPAVPLGRSQNVTPGAQIWVLGYGGLGGVRMHASAGLVSGWTGEHGGAGRRDFMRTDATVAAGSSGGAAVDETGRLIGVPTAYRPLLATRGKVSVPLGQVGLVRPIELARDLLAAAQAGFIPERDAAAVPSGGAVEDGAPVAVMLRGQVVDAASHAPIAGARVVVFRGALGTSEGDQLDRAIAVGTSDGDGIFVADHPIPRGGAYSVAVIGPGYHPLVADQILSVAPMSTSPGLRWS